MITVLRVTYDGKSKLITSAALKERNPLVYKAARTLLVGETGKWKRKGKVLEVRNVPHDELPPKLAAKVKEKEVAPKSRRRRDGVHVPYAALDAAVLKARKQFPDAEQVKPVWYMNQVLVEVWIKGHATLYADSTADGYTEQPEIRGFKPKQREENEEKPSKVDTTGMMNITDVSEQAELEPGDIRKFLRRKGIGKRGGRYAFTEAEAAKIARAAARHYAEKEG